MEERATDFNLVVLSGKLSVEPEYRAFDSGARLIRYLIATRSSEPLRRLDVVPVTQWDPPDELWARELRKGEPVIAIGTVQRRFWESLDGRNSTLEIVATTVEFREPVCPSA